MTELDTFFTSAWLVPVKIIALTGVPGIDTTEIVLEYVYHMLRKNHATIWLNAPSRHQLAEAYVQKASTCLVERRAAFPPVA